MVEIKTTKQQMQEADIFKECFNEGTTTEELFVDYFKEIVEDIANGGKHYTSYVNGIKIIFGSKLRNKNNYKTFFGIGIEEVENESLKILNSTLVRSVGEFYGITEEELARIVSYKNKKCITDKRSKAVYDLFDNCTEIINDTFKKKYNIDTSLLPVTYETI